MWTGWGEAESGKALNFGLTATASEHRHGFQRLVGEIAAGEVGLVLMLEASRLSRCGSDWHRLIELCSLTRTLIADE